MTGICLIAEADLFIANLLQRFATESGLLSARAGTGQDILPMFRQVKPDVLIVEPELPGNVRGWEAIRALQIDQTEQPTVISCSWLGREECSRLMGNVAGHLQKPDLHYSDFLSALVSAGVRVEGSE